MLSAIVSLQDVILFDICGNNMNAWEQITIPRGYMILFSGRDDPWRGCIPNFKHSRLHFYFTQNHTKTTGVINSDKVSHEEMFVAKTAVGVFCPCIQSRRLAQDQVPLTDQKQLQDHWKNVHRKKYKMTLKQHIAQANKTPRFCKECGGIFVSDRSLQRHKSKCNAHHHKSNALI